MVEMVAFMNTQCQHGILTYGYISDITICLVLCYMCTEEHNYVFMNNGYKPPF